MEDLTKQQIILVTLLVSFVTSIATGIITVSYMDQAPTFTQTVNKVVERTIERVVPDASLIKAVEPRIITVEDQVATVAEMALAGLAKIYDETGVLVAIGPVVAKDGTVITHVPTGTYKIVYADNSSATVKLDTQATGTVRLTPTAYTSKTIPLKLADSTKIKPGKTIVLVGGESGDSVFTGIIQSYSTTTGITLSTSKQTIQGAFFLDLTGDVLGININTTYATPR